MDGFQGKINRSLQFRLSAWLSLVILGVALAAVVVAFVSAFQEAIELQDDQLRQMAALINRQRLPVNLTKPQNALPDSDPESRIVVQLLPQLHSLAPLAAGEIPGLPTDLPDGIQTVTVHRLSLRLFVKSLDSGARIAIGQRTSVRDEVARDSAWHTLMPFLVLIPVLMILVGNVIRKMFGPLKTMASDLDKRDEEDLREITDTQFPSEIRPFVVAINRLLSRVAQSVLTQRRFVAAAAHELRSPLTALSLQAERLEAADMSAEARDRLATLRKGIHRNRALLDQLLTLARVQESSPEPSEAVSVRYVLRQVLEDLMPLAEAKHIDLGLVTESDAKVLVTEVDLITLVKNLVANAIRYTPNNGRIDLSIQTTQSCVTLQVADTGPGIPHEERDRVFDAFYRVLGHDNVGSGLGLSIVKTIATRIGARVTLDYSDEGKKSGLCVRVVLPALLSRR
ncbi:MAG: two-component sensor histidine kinase [Polaromonas sp.]|uniref:ATP-binding protein n=1 Tax=Polaromonas sp. TaxID=1869339 RepID=UPI0018098EB1|nr:ATP-binding protein [Polaromonas sp.]NMM11231.1 two-component sensor histidine kinase [Polaromonas sp.]